MKDALKQLPPVFFRSLAYKGVCFPFRTQGHEIIHAGDLKATQWGRNSSTKLACVPHNCLARMQGPTRIQNAFTCKRTCAPAVREKEGEKNNPAVVP